MNCSKRQVKRLTLLCTNNEIDNVISEIIWTQFFVFVMGRKWVQSIFWLWSKLKWSWQQEISFRCQLAWSYSTNCWSSEGNQVNWSNVDPNVQFVVNAVQEHFDNVQGLWKDKNNAPPFHRLWTNKHKITDLIYIFYSIFWWFPLKYNRHMDQ